MHIYKRSVIESHESDKELIIDYASSKARSSDIFRAMDLQSGTPPTYLPLVAQASGNNSPTLKYYANSNGSPHQHQ